ncbi:hypothetical protein DXG01_002577 [Tephrocybe rancida]|nr:hypothetical protein DXG01_002577 [Tephrocybe rancida]
MSVLLSELPLEVLLDNLLPSLQISDLLRLGSNKFFATITSDDTFWRRRLHTDYNFSGAETARTSGWKFIYRGIFRPKVCEDSIKASNAIRDAQHQVKTTISSGVATILTQTVVRVPKSCGRLHASSLDSEGQIWTFPSWGRPFRLVSNFFTDADSKPLQIECGWAFSSVLTVTGAVFVWWPFSGETEQRIQAASTQMNEEGDKEAFVQPDNSIPCVTWDLNEDPARLPSIPTLPDLPGGGNEDEPTQLIQIAGLDGHLIGLTNKGHVLKFNGLQSKETLSWGSWKYLPEFSEIETVESQFAQLGLDTPNSLKITHISANFVNFIAYSTGSSSVVLIGNIDTTSESKPKIIPDLQNKSIISVVLGDYHNAALTSNGKVYTWGGYSRGALGLGDPAALTPGTPGGFNSEDERRVSNVVVPTEVRFDHGQKLPRERFCFSIAAAGWHTGALVIDLEPDTEEEEVEWESEEEVEWEFEEEVEWEFEEEDELEPED